MTDIRKEDVLAVLSKVQDPEIHKDIVTLNMVKDVAIEGNTVRVTIVLTTPACPLRNQIQADVQKAIMSVKGVEKVDVKFDANVRSDGRTRSILNMPVRNVVAVASGKGGVGKTTVAVNLAVSLAQSGARVGLLDADIYGPNVPTMMGVDRLPQQNGEKFIPPVVYGVKVMSIGFMVKPGQPLIWRGPMLHSAIRQFLSDVEWGELDYLIVDLPPGTGDVQLSLTQSVELSGGVIVTLPQSVSLEDARRGLEMFKTVNVPILGVIENMSYLELPDGTRVDVFGQGGGQKLADDARVPFLGAIPMDPSVRIGGDQGTPIVISSPGSGPAIALKSATERIAAILSISAISATEKQTA